MNLNVRYHLGMDGVFKSGNISRNTEKNFVKVFLYNRYKILYINSYYSVQKNSQ